MVYNAGEMTMYLDCQKINSKNINGTVDANAESNIRYYLREK